MLLIDMEMPKGNPRTINIYRDGTWVDAYTTEDGKVIELLPHGDLIDKGELREKFPEPDDWVDPQKVMKHLTGIWAAIDLAPIVIPAEET